MTSLRYLSGVIVTLAFGWGCFSLPSSLQAADRPNIVLIYADDLGFGDVGCYGATAFKTPHIDRLAREGLKFTDAHAAAATCTPSRYAMLTGEYAWRQKGTGILPGNATLIIQPGRPTLPSMLQGAGYKTGVVGKWHLGLGNAGMDWNGPIKPGPLEVGFDYCFLVPATGDRVPCVYVEDHHVVGLDPSDPIQVRFGKPVGDEPTGKDRPELLKLHPSHGHNQTIVNGISRIGYMTGGKSARWVDEDMADTLAGKAVHFIEEHQEEPFFLFFSLHDIHVPRTPHSRFAGKSGLGPRGDVILQLDWCTGEILETLDRLNLADDTLVIFTSDNGPVLDDGYKDEAVELNGDHHAAGPYRGGKYSAFEAGTRVPMIVRWPNQVKPGESNALVCQIDYFASLANLQEQKLEDDAAPDSMDVMAAILGKSEQGRETLVEQARALSLRQGNWKYIEPWKGPKVFANTGIESGFLGKPQLYHLGEDQGETKNLAGENPEMLKKMQSQLQEIRQQGRTRPLGE